MNRNEFRVKEYRGKFYIERILVERKLKAHKEIKVWIMTFSYSYTQEDVITWERVDDYGNHVMRGNTVADARRFLNRRLPYFKTLHKAKAKIEEFFLEPKYHYLK